MTIDVSKTYPIHNGTGDRTAYLQATIQVVWHQRGQTPVVKLDPGRKSVHLYGALDLHSGQETAMMSSVMNSATTARFPLPQQRRAYLRNAGGVAYR